MISLMWKFSRFSLLLNHLVTSLNVRTSFFVYNRGCSIHLFFDKHNYPQKQAVMVLSCGWGIPNTQN